MAFYVLNFKTSKNLLINMKYYILTWFYLTNIATNFGFQISSIKLIWPVTKLKFFYGFFLTHHHYYYHKMNILLVIFLRNKQNFYIFLVIYVKHENVFVSSTRLNVYIKKIVLIIVFLFFF